MAAAKTSAAFFPVVATFITSATAANFASTATPPMWTSPSSFGLWFALLATGRNSVSIVARSMYFLMNSFSRTIVTPWP